MKGMFNRACFRAGLRMAAVAALSVSLAGCLEPVSRSMGATLMPAPLMHRASADSASEEVSVTASGFWGHTGDAYNVRDLDAGGANVDFTYRMGGRLSPLFVDVAVGGFGGSLRFGCDEAAGCDRGDANSRSLDGDGAYVAWLDGERGGDSYRFWNIQERLLAGLDFSPVPFVIVGVAGGLQFFQGGSDYDRMREELDRKRIVDNVDGRAGFAFASAYWLGFRLGRLGRWGNLVAEYDILHKGGPDRWTASLKGSYAHPTGFFAGVGSNSLMAVTVYAGKRFLF